MTRFLPALALCFLLQACAYGIIDDKRLLDTMSSDKAMAASIKAALLKNSVTDGFSISVYCYYDHVFLVGEAPEGAWAKAVEIAKSFRPLSVTPHWFAKGGSERNNLALAAELRAALIGTRGLSSTRVDAEVDAGRVVLLGVVADDKEKRLAISAARKIKGVVSVTSYLMLPQRPGPDKSASPASRETGT